MTAVVVAGALASKPGNGGEAWVRLSWIRGLERLGAAVAFVEESAHADRRALTWFREVVSRFGLAGRSALVDPDGRGLAGMDSGTLRDRLRACDLLVNVSGNLRSPELRSLVDRAAYVDLDPGYTQIWHAQGLEAGLDGHDAHFTVGLEVGRGASTVPVNGIRWRPLPPPVVLDDWSGAPTVDPARLTTVASWRGAYGPAVHGGRTYGVKAHEFRKLARLPGLAPGTFEIALAIEPADEADRRRLLDHGWRLVDPRRAAGTPDGFREYVRGSGAELSAAQGVYVETRCGWFSDRTSRYLAAGRPALVQDTGFASTLPVGEGLLTFSTVEEAAAGARRLLADYDRHARAARKLAEEHLGSDHVLARFLEDAL